jgi:Na+/phosphate symporter
MKNAMMVTLKKLEKDSVDSGHYYVQVLDYLREITYCATFITQPTFQHFNNNHKGLIPAQIQELKSLNKIIQVCLSECVDIISNCNHSKIEEIDGLYKKLLSEVESARKAQVKRLKSGQVSNKNTLLYLNIVQESKNLVQFTNNLLQAHHEFIKDHGCLTK